MLVSVIVPCRNEVDYIEALCHSVFRQYKYDFDIELIVADGMSDDGTRNKIIKLVEFGYCLRLIDNPQKIVSTGLNLAIDVSKGEVIVRMDVHTNYADDYVFHCVNSLLSTGATCVGGPWVAAGQTNKQKAIAYSFQSHIGSGGALSRKKEFSGYVDTVYLGAWKKSDLLKLGGFDESLVRNQDDELCFRIKQNGGSIWQSKDIRSTYFPRSSFILLYRQFMQYGYWKIPIILKHKLPASIRHIVPFVFFLFVFLLFVVSFWMNSAFFLMLFVVVLYFLIIFFSTLWGGGLISLYSRVLSVAAITVMHFGYGVGFGRGILEWVILKNISFKSWSSRLTR